MNETLKTVDIKGTPYVTVATRIVYFRENFKGYSIITEMLDCDDKTCKFKASVIDDKNRVVSTGHAYEVNGNSYINKTSYIENCETSAVGRALGNFGIGTEAAVASADEVLQARANHDAKKEEIKEKIPDKSQEIKQIVDEVAGHPQVTGSDSFKKLVKFLYGYDGPVKYVRASVDKIKDWIAIKGKTATNFYPKEVLLAFKALPDTNNINVDNLSELEMIKKYANVLGGK